MLRVRGTNRSAGLLLALALLTSLFTAVAAPASAGVGPSVFINEIHYDNDGADTGEAVEIAGPAGTDLTGWSVVLYNGSNAEVYDTITLSGTIPDQDNGYGTVAFFPGFSIQNGGPDGLALVDDTADVVQFLSYEGAFTASGGPADGIASTDIGVAEASSSPGGDSLQLTGSGFTYDDFTWADSAPNTFDAVNAGQTFDDTPVVLADPVINEFVANTTGTDTNEYLEVFGDPDGNYAAFTILEIEGDNSGPGVVDGVFPVGVTDGAGIWVSDYFNNEIENGTITLLLVEGFTGAAGDALDSDADGVFDTTPWDRIVDGVAVDDGGSGDVTYTATVLGVAYDGMSYAPGGASRIPNGVDTDTAADWMRNDFDGAGIPGYTGTPVVGEARNTPGAVNAVVEPPAPKFVINEIDYDQPSTDGAEFVEIANVGDAAGSLDGVDLVMINGATDTEYRSFALPDVTLNPGAYFVVCGDAANVANCDLDVSPDSNLIQNGAPDAVALVEGADILDTVSYEGDVPGYTEGSGAGLADTGDPDLGISRLPDGTDTDHNNVDFGLACITPGAANVDTTDCAPPEVVTIPWIQGSGAASDHQGETVTTSGVVTADLQGDAHLNGFFMQDPAGDGDPATSDGIFVYDFYDTPDTDVNVGDLVEVTGTVSEYNGLTELSFVTVTVTGSASVTPTAADLPVSAVDDLERYEGMLLTFPEELTVSEVYGLGQYGEFVVSAGGRQFQPTNVAAPSIPFDTNGDNVADSLEPGRLIVDDGSTAQDPDPVPFLPGQGPNDTLRVGQTTTGLTGVLNYAFGDYSLVPTIAPTFAGNPRPATAPDVGGDITVATFNTLNYWTTFDDGSNDARGADNAAEFTRQKDKTVAAILGMGADVIGLEELENNGPVAIGDLVDALNDVAGAGTWAAVPDPAYPGGLESTNAIKVGIIYRTAAVTPVGAPVADDDPIFAEDRPPVAQTFQAGDEVFTVVVNHFKSKGSTGATGADLDQNDGQGAYNDRRTHQALALIDFVATLQTLSGDPDVLAVGDFNSYAMEDPIETLRGSLTDLADVYIPADGQYSYLYYGMSGLLDHAFASDSLATKVTGAALWHINADEPTLFDYNTEYNPPGFYAANPYRSSDHDPLLIGIDLAEITPIPEIQGSGQFSPYDGQVVTTTGVVTAVSANGRDMWIQDPAGDGDPATSDGIMVDDRNTLPVAPVVGDLVQVTATVQELQFGNALPLTQLNNPVGASFQILSSDNALPDPVKLTDLPNVSMADGIAFWEPLEGMLVSVRRATVVAPTSPYGEFAMLTRWDARGHSGFVSRVSQIFLRALWGGNVDYNPERIVVDDATLDSAIEVRPGDTVRSLTGVVDYTFGMYKLQPTAYDIHAAPLPTGPVSRRSGSRGDAAITTFNVENLFDLVDNPEKDDASSTPTAAELETKLTKLAMAIEDELELPAVLIVQEVENTAILQELGDRVNAAAGTSYVATSFETSDARGIEVGFLWDADRVDLLDAYQLSGPDVEAAFGPSSPSPGREPLVGVFEISGREITIVGNHFKSKSGDDPLYGVNWPPERITEEQRKAQAHVVRDFVNTLFAADRHALVMVAGDLNDFSFAEPGEGPDHPVAILEGSRREVRLTDLVDRESSQDRYSYIYDGNSEVLDHMLVSPELLDLLAGTDILHFNAAYPASVASDASTAIRSSDHDPIEGRFKLRRFHFPWWWWF